MPGPISFCSIMEAFDLAEVLVSEKDILDGLVIQLLEHGRESAVASFDSAVDPEGSIR